MDLTARREPTFHSGAHGGGHDGPLSGAPAHGPSGFTRFVSTLQIVGTVLGVPLALASGYSIYRANFSAETRCQNLRGNIIAMLDRSVDAATRRILVQRDVAAFEQSCGDIDPDATAAFKTLLAVDKATTATAPKPRPAAPSAAVARKSEPKIEPKIEPRTEPRVPAARPPVAPAVAATAEAAPAERDAGMSDARWLAAVRQALVEHAPEQKESASPAQPAPPTAARASRPETLGTIKPPEAPILQQAWVVPPPIASPPPVSAPAVRAPQQVDHPVPPESIPGPPPLSLEPKTADEERDGRSRIGAWISEIPLLGRVMDRGSN